jgi:hypothetical protein
VRAEMPLGVYSLVDMYGIEGERVHINKIVYWTTLIHCDKYSSQGPGPEIK